VFAAASTTVQVLVQTTPAVGVHRRVDALTADRSLCAGLNANRVMSATATFMVHFRGDRATMPIETITDRRQRFSSLDPARISSRSSAANGWADMLDYPPVRDCVKTTGIVHAITLGPVEPEASTPVATPLN